MLSPIGISLRRLHEIRPCTRSRVESGVGSLRYSIGVPSARAFPEIKMGEQLTTPDPADTKDSSREQLESILRDILDTNKDNTRVSKGSGIVGGIQMSAVVALAIWVWNLRDDLLSKRDLTLALAPMQQQVNNIDDKVDSLATDVKELPNKFPQDWLLNRIEALEKENDRLEARVHELETK